MGSRVSTTARLAAATTGPREPGAASVDVVPMPVPPATSPSARPAGPAGAGSWDHQLAPFIGPPGEGPTRPSTWREYCDQLHVDLLTRWLPPQAGPALKTDLFDEAAGTGIVGVLAQRCEQVVGIDVAPTVAAAARQHNVGLRATVCDVRRLAFRDQSFDVVVSNSTLDHFSHAADITTSLRELHRVTRPGGVLVVTLDNPWHPLVAIRNIIPGGLLRRLGLQPYFVGATLSLRALTTAVTSAGWQVDNTTTLMHTLRVAAIPISNRIDRHQVSQVDPCGGDGRDQPRSRAQRRLMASLLACERLGSLPTRNITGHYVAVRAVRS
jgi:SAM-dependent methyltransferase